MKNLFLIIILIFAVSCKAQIYPLNTNPYDITENGYLKDSNNELDKYIGIWKGTWDGKIIYLELKKTKYHYTGNHSYYSDEIVGERKVISSTGFVEIDRISNFDMQSPEFFGISKSLKNGNWQRLHFYPKNMCGKTATLDITNFTGSQMTLHFEYLPSIIDPNCQHNAYVDQYGDFPINFPKDIVLTKQ
jgi:hypothetical protein